MIPAKRSKTRADPFVTHLKNLGSGILPIMASMELKITTHRKMPDRNMITMINLENKSGEVKSPKRITVPADTHQRYDHGH